MKMIKAMKRLKFWSKKKRKKISYTNYTTTDHRSPPPPSRPAPPPPPYYSYYHRPYEPVVPSAPPLPPWVDFDEQLEETILLSSEADSACTGAESESKNQEDYSVQEDISAGEIYTEEECGSGSYQQYMVTEPAYDDVVVAESKKLERANGAFGCFLGFGAHLVQCVFPCFHIKEDRYDGIRKICIN